MWSKKILQKVIDIETFKSKTQFIGCNRSRITRISENKASGQVQGEVFEIHGKVAKTAFSCENCRFCVVGVSLKDLAKSSKINGLQAVSKVLLF